MKSFLTLTLFGVLGGAIHCEAATMFAEYTGYSGGFVDISTNGGVNWRRAGGGLFSFTRVSGGDFIDGPAVGESFITICIEPGETISPGVKEWRIGTLAGGNTSLGTFNALQQDLLLELFGRHLPEFNGNTLAALQQIALQLAVWEIVTEKSGTYNVGAGDPGTTRFRSESVPGSIALASSYLSSLDGTGKRASGVLTMLRSGTQDYAFQVATVPPEEVPEPAHLLGGGLLLLVALKKRLG